MKHATIASRTLLGALTLFALGAARAPSAQTPASPAAGAPPAHAPGMMMMSAGPMRSTPAPGAQVYLISPSNGATVHGPVVVRFGLKGMGIAPAGVMVENTGHHHLLVDTDLADLKLDQPLPATDKVLHFGKGQTETTLTLPPGKHTLELVFADAKHLSFDPPLHSEKITITVE
jgi:hypothetical protein